MHDTRFVGGEGECWRLKVPQRKSCSQTFGKFVMAAKEALVLGLPYLNGKQTLKLTWRGSV